MTTPITLRLPETVTLETEQRGPYTITKVDGFIVSVTTTTKLIDEIEELNAEGDTLGVLFKLMEIGDIG